jgi:hypothetical protein
VVDRACREPFGLPADNLLSHLFSLDRVAPALPKSRQPGIDLVLAMVRVLEAALHDRHVPRDVRRQRVAPEAQPFARKSRARVPLPALHVAQEGSCSEALLLAPLREPAVADMRDNAIAPVLQLVDA